MTTMVGIFNLDAMAVSFGVIHERKVFYLTLATTIAAVAVLFAFFEHLPDQLRWQLFVPGVACGAALVFAFLWVLIQEVDFGMKTVSLVGVYLWTALGAGFIALTLTPDSAWETDCHGSDTKDNDSDKMTQKELVEESEAWLQSK
jgi:hypothetical protein